MDWFWKLFGVCALGWIFFTSDGQELLNSILKGATLETDIEQYDCQMVADLVKGVELQNAFGAKSKILKIDDLSQKFKTAEEIVCSAWVTTSRGERLMDLSVETAGDNQIIYSVQ